VVPGAEKRCASGGDAGSERLTLLVTLVKTAVQELQLAGETKPISREPRQTKAQQRKLIDGAIGELLVLLSQKASTRSLR
jgi:hypothetical protein